MAPTGRSESSTRIDQASRTTASDLQLIWRGWRQQSRTAALAMPGILGAGAPRVLCRAEEMGAYLETATDLPSVRGLLELEQYTCKGERHVETISRACP